MLPNGGFPPIKLCEYTKKKDTSKNEKKEKGFFFTKSNNINIREILKKNSIKKTLDTRDNDTLDIID